jgi:uncharacterized membrane protein YhaH (DUF805 family)
MADVSSLQAAMSMLADRNASPQDLQAIAARYPQLWSHVAQHPNVYPALLEWLRQQGCDTRPPMRGSGFMDAMQVFSMKRPMFKRARRFELWWILAIDFVASLFFGYKPSGSTIQHCSTYGVNCEQISTTKYWIIKLVLLGLIWLVMIVPTLNVMIGRLHDINLSGAWLAIILVPVLGPLALLVMWALPSNPKGIRFEADPDQKTPGE